MSKTSMEFSIRINCHDCEEQHTFGGIPPGHDFRSSDALMWMLPLWSWMEMKIRCPKCTFKRIDALRDLKKKNPSVWSGVPDVEKP